MFNYIRKLLFLCALILFGTAAINIYSKFSPLGNLPIKAKLSNNGIDIEINNFKAIHEISGKKKWELKADHAEVDNSKNLTRLKNVELEFRRTPQQKYWVSADKGVLNNKTKEFELEGQVHLIAESSSLLRQIRSIDNKIPE